MSEDHADADDDPGRRPSWLGHRRRGRRARRTHARCSAGRPSVGTTGRRSRAPISSSMPRAARKSAPTSRRRSTAASGGSSSPRPAGRSIATPSSAPSGTLARAAVVSANFSLGVALFARLVETAAELFGSVAGFDPYLVEWHRRAKADRPSGTAAGARPATRRHTIRRDHARRPRDRLDPSRRVAGHAPRRLRCRRRDRRAPADRARPDRPTRPASWPPPTGCAASPERPASTRSTPSWTNCWRGRDAA